MMQDPFMNLELMSNKKATLTFVAAALEGKNSIGKYIFLRENI